MFLDLTGIRYVIFKLDGGLINQIAVEKLLR